MAERIDPNAQNHYEVLGFTNDEKASGYKKHEDITADEIRTAFRTLSKKYHPDVVNWPVKKIKDELNPDLHPDLSQKKKDQLEKELKEAIHQQELAEIEFIKVSLAYEILSDPHKRKYYDLKKSGDGYSSDYGEGQWTGYSSRYRAEDPPLSNREKAEKVVKEARGKNEIPDLSGIHFSVWDDLSGCDLAGAKFGKAGEPKGIEFTKFIGANLEGADFSNCELMGVDFENANLKKAKFNKVTWQFGSFKNANLEEAEINDVRILNYIFNFEQANLKNATIKNTIFEDPDGGYNFDGANLVGVDLTGSDMHNSRFRKADLTGADLRHLNLPGYSFYIDGWIIDEAKVPEKDAYLMCNSASSCKGVQFYDEQDNLIDISTKYDIDEQGKYRRKRPDYKDFSSEYNKQTTFSSSSSYIPPADDNNGLNTALMLGGGLAIAGALTSKIVDERNKSNGTRQQPEQKEKLSMRNAVVSLLAIAGAVALGVGAYRKLGGHGR